MRKHKSEERHKHKIVIGIDQSYSDTGITIASDGVIRKISDLNLKPYKSPTEKRKALKNRFYEVIQACDKKAKKLDNCEVVVIIERIRLQSRKSDSQQFINFPFIKGVGALNAMFVDVASEFGIKVYSVDTRSWKSQVVGNSKAQPNRYGIDPEKWPTIQYIRSIGYEEEILQEVSKRKQKGVVKVCGDKRYTYNDNRADSACIALYGFIPKAKQKLEEEH